MDNQLLDAYRITIGDSMMLASKDDLKAVFRAMTDYQAALLGAHEGLVDAQAVIRKGFSTDADRKAICAAANTAKQYLDDLNIEDGWERKVLDE